VRWGILMSETMKIPVEWKSIELGDVLNIGTGSKNAEDSSLDGVYPFFTRAENTQKIDNYSYDTEALFIAGEGNFRVKYYKGKFEAHQRTYVLTSRDEDIDLSYLQKAIQPKITKLISTSVGSTVMSLRKPQIAEIEILIPKSKLEQQKIAEILTEMDESISKVEELFEKNNRLKTALMQDLLNYGVDEEGKIRNQQTHKLKTSELGYISDDWDCVELGKVCDVLMGQSPDGFSINQYLIGIPFLQGNAEFKDKFPIEKNWTSNPTKIAEKNSILLSVRAPVGELNIANKDYCIGRGLASIQSKKHSISFLFFVIKHNINKLKQLSQGSTFEAINRNNIEEIQVLIPKSKVEQQKIAQILSSQDEKIEDIKNKLNKLKSLKASLMQDLLSGKKRVTKLMESN
jgi:type I restriction enzyme, S subunit